MNTISCVD